MPRALLVVTALLAALAGAAVLGRIWWLERTTPPAAPRLPTSGQSAPPGATAPDRLAVASAGADVIAALARDLQRPDVRRGEAVLTFKDDAAYRAFLQRAARNGLTVLDRRDGLRSARVKFDAFAALERELSAHGPDHLAAAANALFTVPAPPPREDRPDRVQVPFGNATLAFLGADGDRSAWGRGVTIAVLDTGVAPDATFGSGRLRTLDLGLGTAPGPARADGHGTGVAALAAGAAPDAPGVAPAAGVLSIRVTDADGLSDLFTVAAGIVAATDAGARIINVSLGGHSTGAVLDAALAYAVERGALVVAAAGNDQASRLAWPAADPRVVSVGAVDRAEQQVAFSNSGSQLQLAAPGYGVQTAWLGGERALVSGTSASAPLVAGTLAAVLAQNPGLAPAQAVALLAATASDAGEPGRDPAYGAGILNAGWALNRDNPAYVDPAVTAHRYDAAAGTMEFTVQNRSGRTVTGLSLAVTAGTVTSPQAVPGLAPGESYVVRVPVNPAAAAADGTVTFATHLVNPLGLPDRNPANNRRTSVLTLAPRP